MGTYIDIKNSKGLAWGVELFALFLNKPQFYPANGSLPALGKAYIILADDTKIFSANLKLAQIDDKSLTVLMGRPYGGDQMAYIEIKLAITDGATVVTMTQKDRYNKPQGWTLSFVLDDALVPDINPTP